MGEMRATTAFAILTILTVALFDANQYEQTLTDCAELFAGDGHTCFTYPL